MSPPLRATQDPHAHACPSVLHEAADMRCCDMPRLGLSPAPAHPQNPCPAPHLPCTWGIIDAADEPCLAVAPHYAWAVRRHRHADIDPSDAHHQGRRLIHTQPGRIRLRRHARVWGADRGSPASRCLKKRATTLATQAAASREFEPSTTTADKSTKPATAAAAAARKWRQSNTKCCYTVSSRAMSTKLAVMQCTPC